MTVVGAPLPAPGASGNVLTSDGAWWASAAPSGGGGTVFDPAARTNGFKAWSYDMAIPPTASVIGSGTLYVTKVATPEAFTIGTITVGCSAASSGGTYLRWGVYNIAGTLIGQSALGTDIAAGLVTIPVTAESGQSLAVAGGTSSWVHVCMLYVGSSAPNIARANVATNGSINATTWVNAGQAAAAYRAGQVTSQSAIPTTRPALTANITALFWIGLS